MGCGYCAWACPYGAPQYNPEAGCMTKCNFCVDNLEQGLPPACVAACPLRVLDYGEMSADRGIPLWDTPSHSHPYPLPSYSHTQPRLSIHPHPAMNALEQKSIGNLEEIQPRVSSGWEDAPLILFTLLTQMAIGGFWAAAWIFPPVWLLAQRDLGTLTLLPFLLVGLCLGAGMLASLAHLGTKKNAVHALTNLRKSWLSREILFTGLFGAGWLFTTLERAIWHQNAFESMAFSAILGIGLIYSMGQVYRFPAAPGWNTWRTNASFFVSALLLGGSVMVPLLAYESKMSGVQVLPGEWTMIETGIATLLLAQLALLGDRATNNPLQYARVMIILFGIALSTIGLLRLNLDVAWISGLLFLTVTLEEGWGRWLFYRTRV
jgi:DMSO reductase anchor subunit